MGLFDNLDPVAGLDGTSDQGIFGDIEGAGEISKGFKRGALRLGSNVARSVEAAATATGFGAIKDKADEIATNFNRLATEIPPRVGSFRDVDDIAAAADYTSGLVTENLVQLPITALGAFLGARTGARMLGNTALTRMAGASAGAFTPSYIQNFGDVYNEQREAGFDDPVLAAEHSLPIAAMDTIGPGILASLLLRPGKAVSKRQVRDYLDNILKGITLGAAEEAPTEAIQESLAIQAQAAVDPDFDPESEENRRRIQEAAVGGAVVGGAIGGGGGE